MLEKIQEKDSSLEQTVKALNDASSTNNELREDIEQAEEAIMVYRGRIKELQSEMEVLGQKNHSSEQLMFELKEDMMKLLQYKNDLEVVIEEQTNMIE